METNYLIIGLIVALLYTTWKWFTYFTLSGAYILHCEKKRIQPTPEEVAECAGELSNGVIGHWLRS